MYDATQQKIRQDLHRRQIFINNTYAIVASAFAQFGTEQLEG